jgi:hypothetical protein
MEPKSNPVPEKGERNIYCPFYNGCLDYVISRSWQGWNCSRCQYKVVKQSIRGSICAFNDAEPYYDLPIDLVRGIGGDFFD